MKKLIVVIMALITIFSASVTAYAEVFVDWAVVDYITNLQMSSQNCVIVKYNTSTPTPSLCDSTGAIKTQQTTYSVLLSMYETVTVEGASWKDNVLTYGRFVWYEYGGYCWIKYIPDSNGATCWVANYQGKILYCDAPAEDGYAVSAIAGASTYFITPRPVGTVGNGYLGDFCISRDNYNTVKSTLNNLGGATSYYTILFSVDGEVRYYLATAFGGTRYFVCNSAGQLYYTLKDEPEDVSGTTGGTFDATEVITAINSVYNKLDSGFRVVTKGINETNNRITSLNDDFILHMNNTVSGLSAANGTLNTIADYLSGLMNKQIIERTITYSGTDVFIDWDSSRTPVGVDVHGVDGNIYVKNAYGDLVRGNGGEVYHLDCKFDGIYELVDDENGNPMIVYCKEYPDHGPNPPDSTILYYPFDGRSVNPVVGESTITVTGTAQYAEGVYGHAYVFSENTSALTGVYSTSTQLFNAENGAYTISAWLYPTGSPTSGYFQFRIGGARYMTIRMGTTGQLDVNYYVSSSSATTVSTGRSLTTNEWNHIAVCYDGETLYIFLNGELCHMAKATVLRPTGDDFKIFSSSSGKVPIGTMIDEFVIVDGAALWTSSFDPYEEAVFSMIKDDYYLSSSFPYFSSYTKHLSDEEYQVKCEEFKENYPEYWEQGIRPMRTITYAIASMTPCYASSNSSSTATVPTSMGRLGDDVSYIYFDIYTGLWKLYDCVSKEIFDVHNVPIKLDNLLDTDLYTLFLSSDFTVSVFNEYVVGKPVWLDIPDGGTITVTYLEYVNWFDSIYSLIDMQSDQLTAIVQKMDNATGDTIINIENTVVDITQDSDAFNIFYVEKTDGTTESVGETATDAAKVVGEFLSVFYRLIFADGLENADIMHDFEDVYTVTDSGVNVW